jgi:hypothetical protein
MASAEYIDDRGDIVGHGVLQNERSERPVMRPLRIGASHH